MTQSTYSKYKAILALCLFAPAPSLGVLLALHMDQGIFGGIVWALLKGWLLFGPLVWLRYIEKIPFRDFPLRKKGLGLGVLTGITMFVIIMLAYALFGLGEIDTQQLKLKLEAVGLTTLGLYLGMVFYWSLINSLIEEYIFRFFFFNQLNRLMPAFLAVVAAAAIFTLHHSLALSAYCSWQQNILASIGVFGAAIIWSWLYHKTQSIWPGYISHIFADVAIFGIGGWILFF